MRKLLEISKLICQKFYQGDEFFLPAIRKALIHDAVFKGIVDSGMGDHLCFQGGTALRRCYSLPRLSEDLDFVSGQSLPGKTFQSLTCSFDALIRRELFKAFGIYSDAVQVKVPEPSETQGNVIGVERWSVQVVMDKRGTRDRVHIEIVNVPSHDNTILHLAPVFEGSAVPALSIRTESLNEILADKVLAAAFRPFRKYRDYFDIGWLQSKSNAQGQPVVNIPLIFQKVVDYHETLEDFLLKLSDACETRAEDRDAFQEEISRFVPIAGSGMADSLFEAHFLRGIEFLSEIRDAVHAHAQSYTGTGEQDRVLGGNDEEEGGFPKP
jgi:predicted nucleotidyltransferase component of viral defense system